MRKKVISTLFTSLMLLVGLYFYIQISKADSKVFKVTFFDVGQGDAALINFSNGEKMLIDCSINRKILEKLGQYLPFYDRTIDYLLISHPDSDHYGGCVDVLKRYDVKQIISNKDAKNGDSFWGVWKKYAAAEGAIDKIITAPQNMEIGDANLEFLSPDKALGLEPKQEKGNNNSIIIRLTHGEESFLFMGDAEVPVEKALLKKYCVTSTPDMAASSTSFNYKCDKLRADYLKIGHHGSDSSSDQEFLEAVMPKNAIISVGKNSYGHPSFRTLKKLERAGAEIWRTDYKGDIIVE